MENIGNGTIGYMNSVHFSFPFITKILFKEYSFTKIFALWVVTFLVGSWSYRACKFHKDAGHISYSEVCWLYSVTFPTVGKFDEDQTKRGVNKFFITFLGETLSSDLEKNIGKGDAIMTCYCVHKTRKSRTK